jgi:hypothetical protein
MLNRPALWYSTCTVLHEDLPTNPGISLKQITYLVKYLIIYNLSTTECKFSHNLQITDFKININNLKFLTYWTVFEVKSVKLFPIYTKNNNSTATNTLTRLQKEPLPVTAKCVCWMYSAINTRHASVANIMIKIYLTELWNGTIAFSLWFVGTERFFP